jgi:methyl-accepting chemotaxis protein
MNSMGLSIQHHRKNYFIEKSFQARFILKFCALAIAGGFLTIMLLYFSSGDTTTVAIVNLRAIARTTGDFILPILIQTVAVVLMLVGGATILLTMFISHRIAGPLYRFKKVLKQLEEGDFSSNFSLRNPDQLQDVAEVFNNMITQTRSQLQLLKEEFKLLKDRIDGIKEGDYSQGRVASLTELRQSLSQLNRILNFFKT